MGYLSIDGFLMLTNRLRAFDVFYQQGKSDISFQELRAYSSGWTARYEIYTIQDSKRLIDLNIPLDTNEVWYQILHSLWRRFGRWVIQFPVCISPSGRSITVLRILYSLDINISESTIGYKSQLLSIEKNEAIGLIWRKTRGEHGSLAPPSTYENPQDISTRLDRGSCHGLYTYWVFYSPDEHFLCFIDQTCSNTNSLVLFTLHLGQKSMSNLTAQEQVWLRQHDPMDSQCLRAIWDDRKEFELCFHATYPLLAFSAAGSILLWNFNPGQSSLMS